MTCYTCNSLALHIAHAGITVSILGHVRTFSCDHSGCVTEIGYRFRLEKRAALLDTSAVTCFDPVLRVTVNDCISRPESHQTCPTSRTSLTW